MKSYISVPNVTEIVLNLLAWKKPYLEANETSETQKLIV
jgi:hypothetical protein